MLFKSSSAPAWVVVTNVQNCSTLSEDSKYFRAKSIRGEESSITSAMTDGEADGLSSLSLEPAYARKPREKTKSMPTSRSRVIIWNNVFICSLQ